MPASAGVAEPVSRKRAHIKSKVRNKERHRCQLVNRGMREFFSASPPKSRAASFVIPFEEKAIFKGR